MAAMMRSDGVGSKAKFMAKVLNNLYTKFHAFVQKVPTACKFP